MAEFKYEITERIAILSENGKGWTNVFCKYFLQKVAS